MTQPAAYRLPNRAPILLPEAKQLSAKLAKALQRSGISVNEVHAGWVEYADRQAKAELTVTADVKHREAIEDLLFQVAGSEENHTVRVI